MSTFERFLRETAADIKYRNWTLRIGTPPAVRGGDQQFFLQWSFIAIDASTGKNEFQLCRKWLLSEHMTKSEIVQTAFKAALSAEEHECRETFQYRGFPVFGPHFDVDAMVGLALSSRKPK